MRSLIMKICCINIKVTAKTVLKQKMKWEHEYKFVFSYFYEND